MVSRGKLCVNALLLLSFGFQLIGVLSPPVTRKITLSSHNGMIYGIWGYCSMSGDCSNIMVGYDKIPDADGFVLEPSARLALSRLLIVHVVAAGCTLIMFILSIFLHYSSKGYLTAMLILSLPNLLVSLLAFLVVLLMFLNRLSFASWFLIPGFVLNSISIVVLCISHRQLSDKATTGSGDDEFNDYNQAEFAQFGIYSGRDEEKLIKPGMRSTTENDASLSGAQSRLDQANGFIYHYYPDSRGAYHETQEYDSRSRTHDSSYNGDHLGTNNLYGPHYAQTTDTNQSHLLRAGDGFDPDISLEYAPDRYANTSINPLYLAHAAIADDDEDGIARPGRAPQAVPVLHRGEQVFELSQAAVVGYDSGSVAGSSIDRGQVPHDTTPIFDPCYGQGRSGTADYSVAEESYTTAAGPSVFSEYEGPHNQQFAMPPQILPRGRVPSGPRTMGQQQAAPLTPDPRSTFRDPGLVSGRTAGALTPVPFEDQGHSSSSMAQAPQSLDSWINPAISHQVPGVQSPGVMLSQAPSYGNPGVLAAGGYTTGQASTGMGRKVDMRVQDYGGIPRHQPAQANTYSAPLEPSKSEFAIDNNPDFAIDVSGKRGGKRGRVRF